MKKKVNFNVAGQKAVAAEIDMDTVIADDLAKIARLYPNTFGKAEEQGTYAHLLVSKSFDATASSVKLRMKDGAKMAMDINLPWTQSEDEFSKINGTPEVFIALAGIVG